MATLLKNPKKTSKVKAKSTPTITVNFRNDAPKLLIPTGNLLLNLALSDNPNGGWGAGKMANLIGDSGSGKTMLALTMLAECHKNPVFDDYIFVFDDAEVSLEINLEKLFGETLKNRIIFRKSRTIEDFYGAIYNLIMEKKKFIFILDSFDAISSREELKRAAEFGKQEAKRKDNDDDFDNDGIEVDESEDKPAKVKKEKGSFKLEKPKMAGEIFRVCCDGIAETDSFLLIISQTRENIGFGAMFTPKIRNGGKALKFYATHEVWLATGESHKRAGLSVGSDCMVKVTKNKLTGKRREVYFPVYEDYGVDSIESCINFLIRSKKWSKTKGYVDTHGFVEEKITVNNLIREIENENRENELNELVTVMWRRIEESSLLNRKPKYV
jgi:RecA/RadA recombinase